MNIESTDLSGTTYTGTNTSGSNDLSKLLIGALAGAAVGSLIGGLFTQKGIEIRNQVGEGSKNIANDLKGKASNIIGGITDKYEAVKEGAADLIEKGKQKVGLSSGRTDYAINPAYQANLDAEAKDTRKKVLLGALAVSVAGTIVWSFASDKGIETRKKLGKGSKDLANNIKDKASTLASGLADGIADTYQAAKEGATELLEIEKQKAANSSTGSTSYSGSTGAQNW